VKRIVCLLAVGLSLIAATAAWTWSRLNAGRGRGGPAVPRELFAKPWTDRPVTLLGIGDSITAGYGARAGYSYFDRLARNPGDEFDEMRGISLSSVLPGLVARNIAANGTTSLEHWEYRVKDLAVERDRIGIVCLTTGGNDIIHNYGRSAPREGAMYGATLEQARPWIANYEARLGRMLDRIAESFPAGCHVFVANIYDPTDGAGRIPGLPEWKDGLAVLDAYNEVIARCAAARPSVHLVDIRAAFRGHGIAAWDRWYYTNVEDPNERGYDALRRVFLLEIARHFKLTN
jgi:lysophospholipase L1-like esterase